MPTCSAQVVKSVIGGLITTLVPALPQGITNGLTALGTLLFAFLPFFLTNNPLSNGFPWGLSNCSNTNPYQNPPHTGVMRTYDFTVSRGNIAPDGVNRSVILINGAYPGPLIEANWGDTIRVTVHNKITGPEEGTSMHWHGLLQKGTPWFDGAPAVGQCPIAPGTTFTYQFQADLYGTSWYHSHYSAQYSAGILGPMVIYGPKNAPYDIDVGPVMLSDWYHQDYFTLVQETMTPGAQLPPSSDNNLINGKMNFDCSKVSNGQKCTPNAGLSKFQFQPGKVHRLRLINSGSEGIQQFTIDNHNMTVIANDFVPVKPYAVNSVTLGVGQRTDVLVTGNNNASGAYFMRSSLVCALANQPNAVAAIYYPKANTNSTPTSTATQVATQCNNDDLSKTTPFFPFGAAANPSTTKQIDITFGPNATGHELWYMNNQTFRGNYDQPVLLLANAGNTSYPSDPEWNVYDFGSNSSVRLIVNNHIQNAFHPMHLHGHNFFVLATGVGTWDGKVQGNAANPQRRDTQILPAATDAGPGFMVVQFNQDNPGVWPFHCHIAWHVSAGLYVNVMERPADIKNFRVPTTVQQTCRDWANFAGHNFVDQIDSGLKRLA